MGELYPSTAADYAAAAARTAQEKANSLEERVAQLEADMKALNDPGASQLDGATSRLSGDHPARKEPTLTELMTQAQDMLDGQFHPNSIAEVSHLTMKLALATAKAVQELWEHQHQVITQAVLGGTPMGATTTKPIGYASRK
jgi:hypothetical protein